MRDLLPIISFSLLRGRCRHCQQSIGEDSVCIEVSAVIVGALPFVLLPATEAATLAIFGWLLLPLAILDFRHMWLPDSLVAWLAVAGLTIAPLFENAVPFTDRLMGAATGFAALEFIKRAYRLVRQRDGMGAGDPKLLAAIGIWQGWQFLPFVLLLASVIGIAWHLAWRNVSFENQSLLPLGSYLSLAAYIMAWIG